MAIVATKDFVRDNYDLKNPKILLIHGIGEGIVKQGVHEELSHNKYVQDYYVDNFNSGYTIAILNLK